MPDLSYDPGDEVQRRFRYQINYAALKALQMLAPDTSVRSVYCEHLEDVLVEGANGFFTGIQVKTRELDQPQLRLSDKAVSGALKRFCVRDGRETSKLNWSLAPALRRGGGSLRTSPALPGYAGSRPPILVGCE